jgi:hypothetical protein
LLSGELSAQSDPVFIPPGTPGLRKLARTFSARQARQEAKHAKDGLKKGCAKPVV